MFERCSVRHECKSASVQLHGQLHRFGQFIVTAYGHSWRDAVSSCGVSCEIVDTLFCTTITTSINATTIHKFSLPLQIHDCDNTRMVVFMMPLITIDYHYDRCLSIHQQYYYDDKECL